MPPSRKSPAYRPSPAFDPKPPDPAVLAAWAANAEANRLKVIELSGVALPFSAEVTHVVRREVARAARQVRSTFEDVERRIAEGANATMTLMHARSLLAQVGELVEKTAELKGLEGE